MEAKVAGAAGLASGSSAAGREAHEALGHLRHEAFVVQVPGGGEDHVARSEAGVVEVEDDWLGEAGDALQRAQRGPPQRVALPEVLRKRLVDQVVGAVLVHLDLLQNHALLAADVLGRKGRVENQVAEKFKRRSNILIQYFDVEADVLLASECVQVPADGVHLARKLTCVARRRSLEDHVLDEVRDAVQLQRLVARAGANPHAHGDGADVRDALGQHQ